MSQYDISMPRLPEFDFSRVEMEWKQLMGNIPEVWKYNNDGREFQVGESFKARGLMAQHPVVLIPGVVSCVRHIYRLTSGEFSSGDRHRG
jgi:phospholipid:diacylglycerol acyltransferase